MDSESLNDDTRIKIPFERWTPIKNEIIDNVLGGLREKRSALVFLTLYDRAWHHDHKVTATLPEVGRWTGLDRRTVAKCIAELEQRRLIVRRDEGVPHSHVHKPTWRVPLANFSLDEEVWSPVPRFIITKYFPVFPSAVLLVVLLRYQHVNWQNKCWPGVPKLCERTGWSPMRVRSAIRKMGHEGIWNKLRIKLPCPMAITYSPDGSRRRYRVRAVSYLRKQKGRPFVVVSREFAERFCIPVHRDRGVQSTFM